MKKVKITPSMLASDHGNLRQEVQRVQGWGGRFGVYAQNGKGSSGMLQAAGRVSYDA